MTIFCAETLIPSSSSLNLTLEAIAQSFKLPNIASFTPADAVINILYTEKGAPSFFSLIGTNGVLSSSALSGNYFFTIQATDSISGLSVNISVTL